MSVRYHKMHYKLYHDMHLTFCQVLVAEGGCDLTVCQNPVKGISTYSPASDKVFFSLTDKRVDSILFVEISSLLSSRREEL